MPEKQFATTGRVDAAQDGHPSEELKTKMGQAAWMSLSKGWRISLLFATTIAVLICIGIWDHRQRAAASVDAIVANQLAEFAASTKQPVVGNLGGLRVTFPPNFAELVEYEGDPGFGERRKGPVPKRTHESSITSMGFDTRHPDLPLMTIKDRELEKSRYRRDETPWMGVSIIAGSRFGDGEYFEFRFATRNRDPKFQYEMMADRQFGLEVFTPVGVDKSLRLYHAESKRYRLDMRDRDYFVYRASNGRIDASIECSNVAHDAAPCTHDFYIGETLKVKVTIDYRRGMLPHWKEIQQGVTAQILSFSKV